LDTLIPTTQKKTKEWSIVMLNHYKVLGLSTGASKKEIHSAYRTLVKKYHPDSNLPEASIEKFRAVKASFEALKIEKERGMSEAHHQALSEIERFESLAARARQPVRVANSAGFTNSYAAKSGAQQGNIIAFPAQRRSRLSTFERAMDFIALFVDRLLSIKDEYQKAKERCSNLQHRTITHELNRIPESEIGVKQEAS
jgi:DnaJ-class molecular chaperone